MFERALAAVAVQILKYLETRRESTAVDADEDRAALRRAGDRLREWMRKPNGVRAGGEPDAGGAARESPRVPPG